MFRKIISLGTLWAKMTKRIPLEPHPCQSQLAHELIKNSATEIKASLVALLLIFSLNHGSANAAPCSCWSNGNTAATGGECWAAWDTEKFSKTLTPEELDQLTRDLKLMAGSLGGTGGAASLMALVLGMAGTGPLAFVIPVVIGGAAAGVALAAGIITGVKLMESCRVACTLASEYYDLDRGPLERWWYADTTSLESCYAQHPEVVNKY